MCKIYQFTGERCETYFIETSINENYAYGYLVFKLGREWKFVRKKYDKKMLKDNRRFPVAGHIEFADVVADAVLKAVRCK